MKGSKRKGARMKWSHHPLETSKPERSAQTAVALKRTVTIARRSQNPQCWIIPKRQNCTSLFPMFGSKSQAAGGPALLRKHNPAVLRAAGTQPSFYSPELNYRFTANAPTKNI